jgi:hypothetical protein
LQKRLEDESLLSMNNEPGSVEPKGDPGPEGESGLPGERRPEGCAPHTGDPEPPVAGGELGHEDE